MKRLNQTESPIFVILYVLCLKKAILFLILITFFRKRFLLSSQALRKAKKQNSLEVIPYSSIKIRWGIKIPVDFVDFFSDFLSLLDLNTPSICVTFSRTVLYKPQLGSGWGWG